MIEQGVRKSARILKAEHYQLTGSNWHLYNPLSPNSRIYFFKYSKTFTKLNHILGYRTNFVKLKRIKITWNIFSDHNTIKLEIDNRRMSGKSPNIWKLNNTLVHKPWFKEEVSRKLKNTLNWIKIEKTVSQFVSCTPNSANRKFYHIKCLY